MSAERRLIVNADDFGQSPAVNRGAIDAHERGIVTSASLMVRWPAAREAAAYARGQPRLSVGLHLDLGEWAYRERAWVALYQVAPSADAAAVAAEIDRQLAAFRELLGRDPTHLDSHQHVHREEPARSLLVERARRLGIPVRHYTRAVRYSGAFYGQTGRGEPLPEAITVEALIALVKALPAGVTELGCHPGAAETPDPSALPTASHRSMYEAERPRELAVLCDPRVREAIAEEGIALRSFRDVWNAVVLVRGCG